MSFVFLKYLYSLGGLVLVSSTLYGFSSPSNLQSVVLFSRYGWSKVPLRTTTVESTSDQTSFTKTKSYWDGDIESVCTTQVDVNYDFPTPVLRTLSWWLSRKIGLWYLFHSTGLEDSRFSFFSSLNRLLTPRLWSDRVESPRGGTTILGLP